ncbi:hypothetical protein LSUCC0387_05570 [Rhodobacterales bacterium LSUCC0387]|nr:hypothetical protein [Rhodobacterales bacterium LSUCC0387]
MTTHEDSLVVGILMNGRCDEWAHALDHFENHSKPRLPIPYSILAKYPRDEVHFVGISFGNELSKTKYPFSRVVSYRNIIEVRRTCDVIVAWGRYAILNCILDLFEFPRNKKTIIISYDWPCFHRQSNFLRSIYQAFQSFIAKFSRGVSVMTEEQKLSAKSYLPPWISVEKIDFRIDASFYKYFDPVVCDQAWFDKFSEENHHRPYMVMLGDELRIEDDAITVAKNTEMSVVRVCQYMNADTKAEILHKVSAQGLISKYHMMNNLSYGQLLLLLRNASGYLGLVDSTWQPAGWTSLSEALCCRLPAIVYDGLVSREMQFRGIPASAMKVIASGDVAGVCAAVSEINLSKPNGAEADQLSEFVKRELSMTPLIEDTSVSR